MPLLVEIKGEAGDDVAAISAATAGLLDSYDGVWAVQSFNPFALQWFKDNRPDVPCFAWTLHSQEELDRARAEGFVGFIFDGFEAHL